MESPDFKIVNAYVEDNAGYIVTSMGIVSPREKNREDPFLIVCGFGSGWTGIRLIGIYSSILGKRMSFIPSLPGYGDSIDIKIPTSGFDSEADTIHFTIQNLRNCGFANKGVHFIGHSMGALVGVELAKKYPNDILSLSLLNPAGLIPVSGWELLWRFTTCGIAHNKAFKHRNDELTKIWEGTKSPKEQKSSFASLHRLLQRISEIRRLIGNTYLRDNLPLQNCPTHIISGSLDTVYPPLQFPEIHGVKKTVLEGAFHNSTILGADRTAQKIVRFIETLR